MAHLHLAYTFDALRFAERFSLATGCCARKLSPLWAAEANGIIRNATSTLEEALAAVRYDEDWLSDTGDEAFAARMFLVCLLSRCGSAVSLGRAGEPPYHLVLEVLLKDAGWTGAQVDALLLGEALSEYPDVARFGLPGLDDLGGWIGYEKAVELKRALEAARPYFLESSGRHESILGRAYGPWGARAGSLAREAYQRALDMLSQAGNRNRALFVVLD